MGHYRMWMARAAAAVSLLIPFSALPTAAEERRGFFFGAGWPGGGQVFLFGKRQGERAQTPSDALNMQTFTEGAQLQRRNLGRNDPVQGGLGPVQLRAGYDFGNILGYMAFEDTNGHEMIHAQDPSVSLGFAVPVSNNLQITGEVTQDEGSQISGGSDNTWSLTAGFRF